MLNDIRSQIERDEELPAARTPAALAARAAAQRDVHPVQHDIGWADESDDDADAGKYTAMDIWEEAQDAVGSRRGRRALTLKERQAADPLDRVKHRMNTASHLRDLLEARRYIHTPSLVVRWCSCRSARHR
jgi:hypothetical protein